MKWYRTIETFIFFVGFVITMFAVIENPNTIQSISVGLSSMVLAMTCEEIINNKKS